MRILNGFIKFMGKFLFAIVKTVVENGRKQFRVFDGKV